MRNENVEKAHTNLEKISYKEKPRNGVDMLEGNVGPWVWGV